MSPTANQGDARSSLFVVSNVGQARNAFSVAQARSIDATFVCLWTESGAAVRDAICELAARAGQRVQCVELPPSPTDLLPNRVRAVAAEIDQLRARFATDEVWISNINSFYGYLAWTSYRNGATINFFEEGLGSYRRGSDAPYAVPSTAELARTTWNSAVDSLHDQTLSPYRRVRRALYRTANGFFRSRFGFWMNRIANRGAATAFYRPWTQFGEAVVAFPDALDRQLVCAAQYGELEIARWSSTSATPRETRSWPLLLTQPYDVAPTTLGRAIASALRSQGHEVVSVKSHPREAAQYREGLADGITQGGVQIVEVFHSDATPAEKLIFELGFREVVGLTSSTLIYGPAIEGRVRYRSICRDVLDLLRADRSVPASQLERLGLDCQILDRVLGSIGTHTDTDADTDSDDDWDTVVVGASGPSITQVDADRVPAKAKTIRVNNFFFEDHLWLGPRVDCIYFSADPRAIRFFVATLRRVLGRGIYDVRSSASHSRAAARLRPPQPFYTFVPTHPEARALIERWRESEGVLPSTGVMALLYAQQLGAKTILIAGLDLYGGSKYAYDVPPNLRRLLRPNMARSGYDTRLHRRELDLEVIEFVRRSGVAVLALGGDGEPLGIPLAPKLPPHESLADQPVVIEPETDWVRRDGLISVDMLVLLRRMRALGSRVERTLAPSKSRSEKRRSRGEF